MDLFGAWENISYIVKSIFLLNSYDQKIINFSENREFREKVDFDPPTENTKKTPNFVKFWSGTSSFRESLNSDQEIGVLGVQNTIFTKFPLFHKRSLFPKNPKTHKNISNPFGETKTSMGRGNYFLLCPTKSN